MRKIVHKVMLTVEIPIGMILEDGTTQATVPDLEPKSGGQFFVDLRGAKRIRAKTMPELIRKLAKDVEESFW